MRKWFKKNDDEIIEIQVDDTERRIIVRALADLRDKQRLAHKNYDFLDSLIVKVCDADHPSIKDHYVHMYYYWLSQSKILQPEMLINQNCPNMLFYY